MLSNERSERSERSETIWERRVTVILISVLVMIGGFTAKGVYDQSTLVGRIEERLDGLSKQMDEMKDAMKNRYTKGDASRDFRIRDRQIEDLRGRVQNLERENSEQ